MRLPASPPDHQDVGAADPFSIEAARELDIRSQPSRILWAVLFGGIGLADLPWPLIAIWITAVMAWEVGSGPLLDRIVDTLKGEAGIWAYAVCNAIGSSLFYGLALLGLAHGSPIGVVIGATWLAGSFFYHFVYYGQNRRLLWSCNGPGVLVAVLGPILGHGLTVTGTAISAMLLSSLVAAWIYAKDYQVLSRRLADRQLSLVDVKGKLAIAVESSGDGLFEADLIAQHGKVSPAWAAMLGYAADDITFADLFNLVHPDDRPAVREEYAAHFRDETSHTTSEQRMRCKDGSYKWVLARARLVSRAPDGRPWRLIGTTIDVTARKALEHQLEAARDTAEAANAAKSVFMANMSHEIRTPLNGVIGIAGALARTPLTGPQREMVGLVQSSAQILERLLSDVLDQSKLAAGVFELQCGPFDLRQAVEAAAELMRVRAEDKGLGFHIAYADTADGVFEGDAVRLRQIISNLASNAIKFTEAGEVRIDVDVTAPDEEEGPTATTIAVADTGIGFDAQTGERLFGRFVQADSSIARRFGGSGLGLAISRALAERMDGTLSATSTPGVGSVFALRIALRRTMSLADYRQRGAGTIAPPTETEAGLEGLRVLLAEDHPTNQRVVELLLGPLGVHLTIVGDGQDAIDAFAADHFDLILMDMQMPVVDGLSATREIRRREREKGLARTPIAMLTANAMPSHRAMAAEAGASHHIAKPITPESLIGGIVAALAADTPAPSEAAA